MLYTDALLEVRARLGELAADFWLDDELYRAINEGVTRFSQEEKWPYLYTVTDSIPLPANQATLALQPGVAYERHFNMLLSFSGDNRPRKPRRVHPSEGYNLRLNYTTAASEPLAYYISNQLRTGQDEVQSVANTGSTTGNFTLTYDGQTTGNIARGATAATIATALKALSNIGDSDVVVWGGPLGTDTVYVRFVNNLGATDLTLMTLGGTTTSMTVAQVSAGGAPDGTYTPVVRFVPVVNRASTIEYQYIRDPVQETTSFSGKQLDVPAEYAMGVCAYATGHAFLKELNFSKKADEQFALYQKAVGDAKRESRKVTPDSGLVWGRSEPQYGWVDPADELLYSIPSTLGP
jgi:hypothetical protein